MNGRAWLENLLQVAVILMVPTIACIGYYAMIGAGELAVGIARVAGVAIGLVSLLGIVMGFRATKDSSKTVVFWGMLSLLALFLIWFSY